MPVCELAVVGHLEPDYKRLSEEKLGLRTTFAVFWGLPFGVVSAELLHVRLAGRPSTAVSSCQI